MAEQVKYLDYAGLELLVTKIKAGDAAALQAAKTYVGAIPAGATQTTVIAYLEQKIADAQAAATFSGKAEDVTLADANNKFDATNVEDALAEVKGIADTNKSNLETVMSTDATKAGSIAKALADAKKYTDDEIGDLGTYGTVKAYVDAHDAAVMKIISNEQGTLTDLTTDAKTTIVAAINEVDAHADAANTAIGTAKSGETAGTGLTGRIEVLEEAVGSGGSVDTKIKNAIEALDAEKSQTAGADGLALSITEVDGKITAISGSIAANTYDAHGAAAAVQGSTTETVKSVDDKVTKLADDSKVYLDTAETATEGYLKTYVISQGKDAEGKKVEIGKIDIPKELVVTAGEVVKDPEGQPAGTYIKLTIANQEAPIFINVKDLVDVYTAAQGATQVQVAVSDTNVISATIVAGSVTKTELATAVVTEIEAATTAIGVEPAEGVEGSGLRKRVNELEKAVGEGGSVASQIKTAIEALDAEKSQEAGADGLALSITEVDGKITAISGSIAAETYDAYGAASTVKSEVIGTATDAKTADTVNGAKAFATDAVSTLQGGTTSTVKAVEDKIDAFTNITDDEITALFAAE